MKSLLHLALGLLLYIQQLARPVLPVLYNYTGYFIITIFGGGGSSGTGCGILRFILLLRFALLSKLVGLASMLLC
jgi:hypothetical protein